jgi:hypothetical protein
VREYGQVQCGFWQSDVNDCGDGARLLALYLMTCPHSNGIGCYALPDGYAMADLRWSEQTLSQGFTELFRNGFAYRLGTVVFLPNFLRWNTFSNGNVAQSRMAEWRALPKGEGKSRTACALLKFAKHLTNDHRNELETVAQTVSKGLPQQNPTQPNPNPTQEEISSLRSDSSPPAAETAGPDPAKPALALTSPADLTERKAERLKQVTAEAVAAYNATLAKPVGKLAAVSLVNAVREKQVNGCLATARAICERQYNSPIITPQFWADYFSECARDPFKNGTGPYRGEHANWRPDFEYLVKAKTMTNVYERAASEAAA